MRYQILQIILVSHLPTTVTLADVANLPELFSRFRVYFPESDLTEIKISKKHIVGVVRTSTLGLPMTGLSLMLHEAIGGGSPLMATWYVIGRPARTFWSNSVRRSTIGATMKEKMQFYISTFFAKIIA